MFMLFLGFRFEGKGGTTEGTEETEKAPKMRVFP